MHSFLFEDWEYWEVEGNGTWVHSGPQEGQEEDTESDPVFGINQRVTPELFHTSRCSVVEQLK